MISSKSYESCTDTRIYQIHKNIQIIILLENEAPCIKKLFHFFLFFFLIPIPRTTMPKYGPVHKQSRSQLKLKEYHQTIQ